MSGVEQIYQTISKAKSKNLLIDFACKSGGAIFYKEFEMLANAYKRGATRSLSRLWGFSRHSRLLGVSPFSTSPMSLRLSLSCALCAALAVPALAEIQVYNNDEKAIKVNLYGALLGYTGGGGITTQQSGDINKDSQYIAGIQVNSRIGIDTHYDKFMLKLEIGAQEPSMISGAATGMPGIRKFFGQYDFGKGGKLLFGRNDSPTVEGGFNSDFLHQDTGSTGFGSVITGNRDTQLAYSNAGVSIALIQDHYTIREVPRVSIAYQFRNKGTISNFKVGATYKYYNANASGGTRPASVGSGHAWNVIAGVKPVFGPVSLSVFVNYGINGDLYGEQRTSYGTGNFNYGSIATGTDTKRGGGFFELSYKANDALSLTLGAGYQLSYGGNGATTNRAAITQAVANEFVHSYKVSFQVPYKVSKNFTIVPHIGWYNSYLRKADRQQGGITGVVRFRYDI